MEGNISTAALMVWLSSAWLHLSFPPFPASILKSKAVQHPRAWCSLNGGMAQSALGVVGQMPVESSLVNGAHFHLRGGEWVGEVVETHDSEHGFRELPEALRASHAAP